jgi:hypothetical protein
MIRNLVGHLHDSSFSSEVVETGAGSKKFRRQQEEGS